MPYNYLTIIDEIFINSACLHTIMFQNNLIHTIKGSWSHLKKLKMVNLYNNKLVIFEKKMFMPIIGINKLNIEKNEFNCHCKTTKWVIPYTKLNPNIIRHGFKINFNEKSCGKKYFTKKSNTLPYFSHIGKKCFPRSWYIIYSFILIIVISI